MKRWIFLGLLFSILLGYPPVAAKAFDPQDRGRDVSFSLPFVKIPIGSQPKANSDVEHKEEGKLSYEQQMKEEKKIRDKKVDDAIKKAWEEK
jgi:hypothetical protein